MRLFFRIKAVISLTSNPVLAPHRGLEDAIYGKDWLDIKDIKDRREMRERNQFLGAKE